MLRAATDSAMRWRHVQPLTPCLTWKCVAPSRSNEMIACRRRGIGGPIPSEVKWPLLRLRHERDRRRREGFCLDQQLE